MRKELANPIVFPAYAGVILDTPAYNKIEACVPRVCGGDPVSS